MVGLLVSNLIIQSHKGQYRASFHENISFKFIERPNRYHVIVDKKVKGLYEKQLQPFLKNALSVLSLEATERNKSLESFPDYIEYLVEHSVRRDHCLIAIGGGIIQDITCFIAATLLRGMQWYFCPTTLLAQADSCIGSKSSINCGYAKNILGTFTPSREIIISSDFLKTLDVVDVRSGVGEILKVHAIHAPESFDEIAHNYHDLFKKEEVILKYIYRSLEIKKYYIEIDEFDRNERNVMNYGHSFGHAIESAVHYVVPHGIAVTMGMDMANYVAYRFGFASKNFYAHMHEILQENCKGFQNMNIPANLFFSFLSKDKKNLGVNTITLILPDQQGKIKKQVCTQDAHFKDICLEYLSHQQL